MLFTEYNEEKIMEKERAEGKAEGKVEGKTEGIGDTISIIGELFKSGNFEELNRMINDPEYSRQKVFSFREDPSNASLKNL